MKPIITFFLIFQVLIYNGQGVQAIQDDARVEAVKERLNLSSTSGKLSKIAQKYHFKGVLEYQFSWKKGGRLLYCRNVFSDTKDNVFLSRFQRQLMKEKAGVKIKKGEQLKFSHTFKF